MIADEALETLLPFNDDAAIRRVYREGILLLGGGRALLMQLAHPKVAQGVAEHSSFRKQRFARLLRTLRPTLAIVFGSREQAMHAAASINRVHQGVAGPGYSAQDRDLLLWVLATLIDTTLLTHELFVRPLDTEVAEEYYEQMKLLGSLLDLGLDDMPEDLAAFRIYLQEMLETLHVTPAARALAQEVFRAPAGPWAVMWPLRHLTAGLLPPRLRDEFGLTWGPRRERALVAMGRASRLLLPVVPPTLRHPPFFLLLR